MSRKAFMLHHAGWVWHSEWEPEFSNPLEAGAFWLLLYRKQRLHSVAADMGQVLLLRMWLSAEICGYSILHGS